MKRGIHAKKTDSKKIALVLALTLALGGIIGGSIAWLTDKTEPVNNTFTVGDINIALEESKDLDLKMVPGKTLTKDPKVTVKADSEACWLFVEIEKGNDLDTFLTYEIAEGWTKLEDGVYYRKVAATTADAPFKVLKDDQVIVLDSVTKTQLNALTENTYPTLTFTAYAVQLNKNNTTEFTAAEAWAIAKPSKPL